MVFSSLVITRSADPSLIVEVLAAVTVPSFVKTGFSEGIIWE
jgi:hypothetical protein